MHASETSVAQAGEGDHIPCQEARGNCFTPPPPPPGLDPFEGRSMREGGAEADAMAALALVLWSNRSPMSEGETLAVLSVTLFPEGVGSMHQAPALTLPASMSRSIIRGE